MWTKFQQGSTIGQPGSENGIILSDEEIAGTARVTLEKCAKYYAITCGFYDILVHTCFVESQHQAEKILEEIKSDLVSLNHNIAIDKNESYKLIDDFVRKYSY